MNILEKELEEIIYETIKQKDGLNKLYERGLWSIKKYDVFARQSNLGDYGRLDMVGFKFYKETDGYSYIKTLRVGVFELKKGEINASTFFQAIRYCKGIEKYIDYHYKGIDLNLEFEIALIGTSICKKGDFIYLPDYMNNLALYTTKLSLDQGITFHTERGYCLTDANCAPIDKSLHNNMQNYIKEYLRTTLGIQKGINEIENITISSDEDDLPF